MRYPILLLLLASLAGCAGISPVAPHYCEINGANTDNCQAKQIGF